MNCELPDIQAGFRKARGTRNQIANIHWIIKKGKRVPEKCLLLLYWLCQSLWLCGSQQTVENSSRDENTRPPDLLPEKSVCRLRSNSQNAATVPCYSSWDCKELDTTERLNWPGSKALLCIKQIASIYHNYKCIQAQFPSRHLFHKYTSTLVKWGRSLVIHFKCYS